MTTADWFEWGAQANGNLAQYFAIYLTLTSAYLVIAFIAGEKLSRAQLALINSFYIICVSFNTFVQMTVMRNVLFAVNKAASAVEDMEGFPQYVVSVLPIVWAIICAAIALGSLKFMWDVRHSKAD